jgi:NitT/TauT family transport system substrate-binding protein
MAIMQSRRRFLTNAAGAGAAGFGVLGALSRGGGGKSHAAEPPPEITTIRLEKDPGACIAPLAAEELLRAEGFTDIRYVEATEAILIRAQAGEQGIVANMIAQGEVDFARDFAPSHIRGIDSGAPITILTGLHLGCFEVLGRNNIRSIMELKGKTVGAGFAAGDRPLLAIMVSLLGLDPERDIRWVTSPSDPLELFVEGKVDAFIASPPLLQEARARSIGHVLVSGIADRPWSQYYCCMLAASTEFTRKYPVATKRALRAILKAADLCASDPAAMARLLVDKGFTARYDYTLQALNELRYDVWRDYDPEDTLRFYALRLHEAGLIKSSPQKLIAEHTDWRFLNELKRELKA